MKTSLLAAIQNRFPLPIRNNDEIHYPDVGVAMLSKMEKTHFWFSERRRVVDGLLREVLGQTRREHRESPSVCGIDVGCGSGFTARWLNERGWLTYGLDARKDFQAYEGSENQGHLIQADLFAIDPMPEFDFALLLDVIEHVEDDLLFVNQVSKLLKPGGILVISVPAFSWLWSPVDDFSGHLRRYSKRDLLRFNGGNLRILKQSYFFGSTLPFYLISRTLSSMRQGSCGNIGALEREPPFWMNGILKGLLFFFNLGLMEILSLYSTGLPLSF